MAQTVSSFRSNLPSLSPMEPSIDSLVTVSVPSLHDAPFPATPTSSLPLGPIRDSCCMDGCTPLVSVGRSVYANIRLPQFMMIFIGVSAV
ncbi:hypothetical protein D9757_008866 [Collybiopsis confluens]|uniref:Uncharacterized protein n=1 Tax=Collybiopsis confluens TaxID=2823264 RepID=A0A8H5H3Y7_9AGAR|nr:hypothetical protein D9757_008866 [Collybiopsis confluens]